jgi:hypothetical protein
MVRTIKLVSLAVVLLLVVLAVPFSLANVAKATCTWDVWVAPPPFGNDSNPGTQSQPFATIQAGVNEACDGGGTVHVAAGTYHEHVHIDSAKNLTGAGAPTTIIDGGGTGTVLTISSNPNEVNIISGFTIQNGSTASANLWNPADEQVLYAGIKLPSLKMLPQLFGFISCGGGIYISQTHIVTLNDCVIKNNEADSGGGICNSGQLTMNRCTVSGNTAIFSGGGISNGIGLGGDISPDIPGPSFGSMTLTNCTISGNRLLGIQFDGQEANPADGGSFGAGIFNAGHMELLNCTIANNSTDSDPDSAGGGFANVAPVTAIFKNTIVANNTAGAPGTNNCFNGPFGVITSLGHNLDSENSCRFNQSTDLINTDPKLGPLQDNTGPTFTHALLEGSPAIDAGDNSGAPDTDQRGIERPQGPTVDIGAFELVKAAAPATVQELPRYSPPMPTINRNLNAATMSVQFVSVNPQQVIANQPVTISTNVINTGDAGGNYSVALKINGQVEQTRMVSVGPQGTQPIKFAVTRAQPGTYAVDIDGQKGSFTILGGGGTAKAPVNGGLIAILVIGMLVLAAVMVLLLSRRPA